MKFDIHESFDMQTSLALISNENVAKDEWKIRSFIFALMFLRPSLISFVPSSHNYTSATTAIFILHIVQNYKIALDTLDVKNIKEITYSF